MPSRNRETPMTEEQIQEQLAFAREAANNQQIPLPGLSNPPAFLPATLPNGEVKARRLSDLTRPSEANCKKEHLIQWGPLYLVASQIITTDYPKKGDQAYLFSFRTPRKDGVWSEFFGFGQAQREQLHLAITVDPSSPVGPLFLHHMRTRSDNDFYMFREYPQEGFAGEVTVTEDSETITVHAIADDDIPF